ncbi:MAG: BamA/TamA family outer membrane protein, partial [Candidatus Eremiobacteraeota bacterium]|nr:BamA/TamA family outer membrane protein [Candidatus Eremiobacteraeota bacterium]
RVALALISLVALLAPTAALSAASPTIVSVDVTGNVHVPTDKILAILEAKPGVPYNPKLVTDDLARLNALGYFADVAAPLVRQRPNGIAVTYRVVENPVITKILFNGDKHVPADTLLALMDTAVGQVFNTNTFKQDVLKINSYYGTIGFEGLPSHVKDLNLDPATGALTLQIQEGYTIGKISIGGDPLLPPSVILPVLTIKPGDTFSTDDQQRDFDALKKLYDKFDIQIGNFEGGIDPTTIDNKTGTADVKYNIYVMRVAVVQITGNTKTKDEVIRRELRLRPGMVVSQTALHRDYDRLNNTQFFSKVDLQPKAGPDPKHPELVTLDWVVSEQKTASAQIGFGYSGGISGQGLYGTLGYQDNNLHGTGNSVSVQIQKGSRQYQSQAQVTIPYWGKTAASQKFSFSGTLFATGTTYYYPVYLVSSTGTIPTAPIVGGTPAPVPVTLYQTSPTQSPIGITSTSSAKSAGLTVNVGRRLNDYTTLFVGGSGQNITNNTVVPAPYYFQGGQPNVIVGPTPSPLGGSAGSVAANGSFGISASSIANVNTGLPYRLVYATLGAQVNTLDDYYNPSRGVKASINEIISAPAFGSSFRYTQTSLDLAKFFPVKKTAGTLGIHGSLQMTTGAIPPNSLYTFSDQQLRGFDTVFYGTDAALGQIEFRQPVTPDRKLVAAIFVDQLAYRIRGAVPLTDPYTNRIIGYPGNWTFRGDYGFGIRFDVPQLGLHTVRIDIAKGNGKTHTSFGIGQSF